MQSVGAIKETRLPVVPRKVSGNADDNIHVVACTPQWYVLQVPLLAYHEHEQKTTACTTHLYRLSVGIFFEINMSSSKNVL